MVRPQCGLHHLHARGGGAGLLLHSEDDGQSALQPQALDHRILDDRLPLYLDRRPPHPFRTDSDLAPDRLDPVQRLAADSGLDGDHQLLRHTERQVGPGQLHRQVPARGDDLLPAYLFPGPHALAAQREPDREQDRLDRGPRPHGGFRRVQLLRHCRNLLRAAAHRGEKFDLLPQDGRMAFLALLRRIPRIRDHSLDRRIPAGPAVDGYGPALPRHGQGDVALLRGAALLGLRHAPGGEPEPAAA